MNLRVTRGAPTEGGHATAGFAIMLLLMSIVVFSSTAGCSSSPGGALELIPDDVTRVVVWDVETILDGDVPSREADRFEDAWEDDLEELGMFLNDIGTIVLASGNDGTVWILDGDFDFAQVRDDLDDQDYEDGEYRGYELWTYGHGFVDSAAFIEQDGYVLLGGEDAVKQDGYVLLGGEDAVKNVLKSHIRGSGFLFDDDDTDIGRALQKVGNGWFVMAEEGCDVPLDIRGCEADAAAVTRGKESWSVNITLAFLFRNERIAESESRDIEDFLADELDGEVATAGRFVVITASADENELDITSYLWR